MQREPRVRIDLTFRTIDARRGNDALEFLRRRALMPLAHGRKRDGWIVGVRIHVERRVEDQLAADQAARVVARRVVIVRTQVIGRSIRKISGAIDVEETDFRAAAFVAVANHDDGVIRNQHLVVPGGARIDVRAECVNC